MFERDYDSENDDRRGRIRFWLTVGVGAILTGVVVALVLLVTRANDNYDRSLSSQAHSLEVISQTRSLDAALARAEAALGRFAVGLQKEDGRVYQQQWGVARQYLTLLRRNVRDNPKAAELVKQLTAELDRRGQQLGDAALSANYRQTVAAISKYNAAGHDAALVRIDRLLTELIRNERTLLAERNRIAASDRASLNQAILLFSLLGAERRDHRDRRYLLARPRRRRAAARAPRTVRRKRARGAARIGGRGPHRRAGAREPRAAQRDGRARGGRGPAPPGAEDGGGRPADRRHRA
ncbi:CHASE3 domain-containing protein [Sphingopyxis sp. PET50]|uniref:CHASE3 domain-containing protein n=1 Tax=Sphingopyxis sp. PET50 TaxID=2976533 RepID=UPI0021AFF7E5|nr:CHASE3 domain-containing protein [Sphingopyxis sp. PET50]